MTNAAPPDATRAKILEECEMVSYVAVGIFSVSMFLSLLRPDPTLAVCLFGFYGAHVRSRGALRSFWCFAALSVCVDALWLAFDSRLQPVSWERLAELSRREQIAVTLSVLNAAYKLYAVYLCVRLQALFAQRDAETAGGAAATSSGGALDAGSLAARDAAKEKV